MNLNGSFRVLERHPALLLWLLTLVLWLPWLGSQPLRDWDEGLVASVAHSTMGQEGWARLLPIRWDGIYLNKPPGLHWLIGTLSHGLGRSDWSLRLIPCLTSSLAVPLVVLLREELAKPTTTTKSHDNGRSAWLSGLILMTLLPMARHGRLAMLDGTLVSCSLLLWWGWLRSRKVAAAGLLAGLGGSGILLLKPPALMGFVLIALLIGLAEHWVGALPAGRTRLYKRASWWGLGLLPGLSWHAWHISQRGAEGLHMWGGQGLARVTSVVGENSGAWVMPLTEVLEGGWPWLLLFPAGVSWAWRHRHTRTGCWELGLLLGAAALVLPLQTQLPWYSHLLWAPLSLLCAEGLNAMVNQGQHNWVAWSWAGLGGVLLIGGGVLTVTGVDIGIPSATPLLAGTGLLAGGLALSRQRTGQRRQGLNLLIAGWSLALLMFWQSGSWLWELNETWDPRPIASQVRALPADALIVRDGPEHPALDWYSEQPIGRHQPSKLQGKSYWLISSTPPSRCTTPAEQQPPSPGEWSLWFCPDPGAASSVAPMPKQTP